MYHISDSARGIVESARSIAQSTVRTFAADVDGQGRFPEESMQALAAGGYFGLAIAEEFGGQGQSPSVYAAVVEELAQECASTAMVYVMHVSASQAVVTSSTFAKRDEVLREMAAGRHLCTLAFSERGSRSQFWSPASKLVATSDGGFRTSAQKSWVTSARHAHSFVSSAQKPDAESPLESTLYLVEREADGVAIGQEFDGLGLRGARRLG